MITLQPYTPSQASEWNQLVERSKNGTFLIDRRFMDYHSHRFTDCSLLFKRGSRVVACLPANWVADSQTIYSHQGLTYGGLVLDDTVGASEVLQMFDLLRDHYARTLGAVRMIYKPIPYIYSSQPSDEALYALFRHDARLTARGLSTAVFLPQPLPLQARRRSGIRKGTEQGLVITETTRREDFQAFWDVVNTGLQDRHGVRPVHTVDEMLLLASRFPDNIRLFVEHTPDGELVAGAWLFITHTTVHVQYMATSNAGRQFGALDLLIATLIEQRPWETLRDGRPLTPTPTYFDFGISTESSGHNLNEGLIFQKEGFGARGVCYDFWEMDLS